MTRGPRRTSVTRTPSTVSPPNANWEIAMSKRRRFKQTQSLEVRLAAKAEHLREKAREAPSGSERETLLCKARQFEEGLHMSEWLRTPGLQ